jgi:hypothetical protein
MKLGYRVMQAGRASFFVEKFGPNLFGLFPKWRSLKHPVGMVEMTAYFPTREAAQAYAEDHAEFGDGPKVVAA